MLFLCWFPAEISVNSSRKNLFPKASKKSPIRKNKSSPQRFHATRYVLPVFVKSTHSWLIWKETVNKSCYSCENDYYTFISGSVTEWLGRRTCWRSRVTSPALTTRMELFLGRPLFNSSVMLVNSQLVCLLPVGIFKPIMFICSISFIQVKWHGWKLASCS